MIFTAARPLTRTLLASGTIRSTSSAAIPRRAYHRLLSSSSLSTHSHPLQFSSAEHTAHSKCQHAHPDHQNPYLATRMSSSNEKPEASVKQREGPEDWKYREPYRIHTNEDFHSLYEGSCHCGRVQYSLSREKPLASKFCHCTTCQRLHGSCFQWAAIFHKSDINFSHGHHDLVWYDPTEKTCRHKLPCKVSCGYCRTPIMDEGRNMILLFPTLIKFDKKEDRDKWAPTCHMFYSQRQVDIKDGKPKYKGLDSESDEMDKDLW